MENEQFNCIGLLLASEGDPGLGTPVFKCSSSDDLFIQDFDSVDDPLVIGFAALSISAGKSLLHVRSNRITSCGEQLLLGALLPDRSTFIGTRKELSERFYSLPEFWEFNPFFYYHVFTALGREDLIFKVLWHDNVSDKVRLGYIPQYQFTDLKGRLGLAQSGWDESRLFVLETMWRAGYSASSIAKVLGGITRNAVIGRIHRMGLGNYPRMD